MMIRQHRKPIDEKCGLRTKFGRPHRRTGSLYIAVMGVATIVSIIGFLAITLARAKLKAADDENDRRIACLLALSAVEIAISDINANPSWRSTYVNNVEYPSTPITLGGGTLTVKLVDVDGNLADDANDSVRLYGIGRVGDAVHVHSVDITVSCSSLDITPGSWTDAPAP
jgi:hypothetical protein